MNSRAKGKRGEIEAAKAMSRATGLEFRRIYGQARQGDDAPDIDAPGSPWFVEVKLGKSHRIERAMGQAIAGAQAEWNRTYGGILGPPKTVAELLGALVQNDKGDMVTLRANRAPLVLSREDRGPWLVTMALEDFERFVARSPEEAVACAQMHLPSPPSDPT